MPVWKLFSFKHHNKCIEFSTWQLMCAWMSVGHENARFVLPDYHWVMDSVVYLWLIRICMSLVPDKSKFIFPCTWHLVYFVTRFTGVFIKTNDRFVLFLRQLSTLAIVLTLEKRAATFSIAASLSSIFLLLVSLIIPGGRFKPICARCTNKTAIKEIILAAIVTMR